MKRSRSISQKAFFLFLIIVFLQASIVAASIEEYSDVKRSIVKAGLLAEHSDLSRPFYLAIRFSIEPEWYLYWINPGDSGLPIEIEWDFPQGLQLRRAFHPTPKKFISGDLIAFGYSSEVILLFEVEPTQDFDATKVGTIQAKLDWLACKESCVRGVGRMSSNEC